MAFQNLSLFWERPQVAVDSKPQNKASLGTLHRPLRLPIELTEKYEAFARNDDNVIQQFNTIIYSNMLTC